MELTIIIKDKLELELSKIIKYWNLEHGKCYLENCRKNLSENSDKETIMDNQRYPRLMWL